MSSTTLEHEASISHDITLKALDNVLHDFGLGRSQGGSSIDLVGSIPDAQSTKSQRLNMSLIGAIPSLANAIAATQIYEARGGSPQSIEVDLRKAHNYIDPNIGMVTSLNGQEISVEMIGYNPFLGGIFETKDGSHVVPSAIYVELVYQWSALLGCPPIQDDVAAAIKTWNAKDLERAAELAGLPFAIVQSEESWRATEQGQHMSNLPTIPVQKATASPPKSLSPNPKRPLEGVKVLCVTHAIAGPSAGRTLAEHGASVLQIMYTHGYEHPFIFTYANLGCASARLNLNRDGDCAHMWKLIAEADVWIDSYREGALGKFGFTDDKLHSINPSLIISHVRVYGTSGPWSSKGGFDMQGSASSGMMASCGGGLDTPAWPPHHVINDYTTGYYGALAIQAAILRRMKEGGGYILSPSLTGTAMSILKHFKTSSFPELQHNKTAPLPPVQLEGKTNLGWLKTLRPLPVLSETPLEYSYVLLSAIGSDYPEFPGYESVYKPKSVQQGENLKVIGFIRTAADKRVARLKQIAAEFDVPTAHV